MSLTFLHIKCYYRLHNPSLHIAILYMRSFREAQLGILLTFDSTNPSEMKIYVKEVLSQHADSLGVLPGDAIVAIAGTEAAGLGSSEAVTTLLSQSERPTVIKLNRPDSRSTAASEISETPLTAAAYAQRAKAVIDVQDAEAEVKHRKEELAKAVAKQIMAKRVLDAVAPWRSTPWWTSKDDAWARKYAELVEYKTTNGTTNLSSEDGDLGKWCKNQRKYYNQPADRPAHVTPAVAEGRLKLLDEIGFDLSYKEQSKIFQGAWDAKFAELVQYKNEHGHCNVPNTPGEHRQLGRWVMKQRGYYQAMLDGDRANQKGMTQERVDRLTEIGFCWRRGTNPRKGTKVTEWKGGGGQLARGLMPMKNGGDNIDDGGGGGGGESEGRDFDTAVGESVGI
mmetsp:Transcript_11264/g.23018  ORF Transcript_11264/g.23018 Transcript_11264/m.23018 type:complete len:394 (+) Transcript_11264:95-1276(+)